jgi:hypothetical protein
MDAFGFISEAVTDSLSTAIERRGNLEGIRQRQSGQGARYDVSVGVGMEVEGGKLFYGLIIGTDPSRSSYVVKKEILLGAPWPHTNFIRDKTGLHGIEDSLQPVPDPETLILPLIAGSSEGRKAILDVLRRISIHQFSPQAIRSEPMIGSEVRLGRDGHNAGDILKQLKPADRHWIDMHLAAAISGLRGVRAASRVGRRVIVFEQEGDGDQVYKFDASMMSDGTLRSLGILLALRQSPRPSIALIDEIEDSLHPFAHGVVLDAIDVASEEFPVVVSTHNPEILSYPTAQGERTRVVQWNKGTSQIYSLSREVLADLKPPLTVGRLLRSNALWTEAQPSTTKAADSPWNKVF